MSDKIRRGQLIAPFGVGAITVLKSGVAVIGAGLDHWFKNDEDYDRGANIDREEFEIHEPRLLRALRVGSLYAPPDHRRQQPGDPAEVQNLGLTVPVLRFPRWNVCNWCHHLTERNLNARGAQYCDHCLNGPDKKKRRLVQVRFVAMCEDGHIQDFPWREWAHEQLAPSCMQPMKLRSGGGTSLGDIKVVCACRAERTLNGIMEAKPSGETTLSRELVSRTAPYLCAGRLPWLGIEDGRGCGRDLRGSLLNATNAYFGRITSAIFLPASEHPPASAELLDRLQQPMMATFFRTLEAVGVTPTPQAIRKRYPLDFNRWSDEAIQAALDVLFASAGSGVVGPPDDDEDVPLKPDEYRVLQSPCSRELLQIRPAALDAYAPVVQSAPFASLFDHVSLVEKLRETRVLSGFTRVGDSPPPSNIPRNEREYFKSLFWKDQPTRDESWLPAYVVYGEGLFFRLGETALEAWVARTVDGRRVVEERVRALMQRSSGLQNQFGTDLGSAARFVMIHTFAHLLINRLVFDCGYSSASLRERLYVSNDPDAPMAGVLIYTAAGDADGTMGGLVRMGRPGRLEHVIRRALEGASWCSSDPVCMELGDQGGQGPESCNLAACHDCALVPETSCEHFNRYLDRGLVVGSPLVPELGFFAPKT
jgi:hypothetical protein